MFSRRCHVQWTTPDASRFRHRFRLHRIGIGRLHRDRRLLLLVGLRPSSIGIVAEDGALHRSLTSIPTSTTGRPTGCRPRVRSSQNALAASTEASTKEPDLLSRPRLDHRIALRPRTRGPASTRRACSGSASNPSETAPHRTPGGARPGLSAAPDRIRDFAST
jgi:hypothetical protein